MNPSFCFYAFVLTLTALSGCASQGKPPPSISLSEPVQVQPLPKIESIKLTFPCPTSLKTDLDLYATLHVQTYGEAVDAATLIPHMLEAFMAEDRGFREGLR